MKTRPRVLDACCGAGGAGKGYADAGFEVVGVDIKPQPNYPYTFVQADAVAYVREHGHEFDLTHGSWPCQYYCALTLGTNQNLDVDYPDLIPVGREAMRSTGRPWVIENVPGKHIRRDVCLCGEMYGLGVTRHRWFEIEGWSAKQPAHVKHRGRTRGMRHGQWFDGPYVAAYGDGGGKASVPEMQEAMRIPWTDVRKELTEAIPPAYTEYIGRQFLAWLDGT